MKISGSGLLLAALATLALVRPAGAQTWMTSDGNMRISGKYREGNEVRVETFGIRRRDPGMQFNIALQTVAKLANEKGFPRFALTKVTSCGLITNAGTSQCRLVARMLQDGETVPAKVGKIVTYYRADEVLAGRMSVETK